MRRSPQLVVALALLLGAQALLLARPNLKQVALDRALSTIPGQTGEWRSRRTARLDADALGVLRADDYLLREYENQRGRSVWLYSAYWGAQKTGAVAHSPRHCLPGAGWEVLDLRRVDIPLGEGRGSLMVNRFYVLKDQQPQVLYFWYAQQGEIYASEMRARVAMVLSAATSGRTDGAIVRISTPVVTDVAEADAVLTSFLRDFRPLIDAALPR